MRLSTCPHWEPGAQQAQKTDNLTWVLPHRNHANCGETVAAHQTQRPGHPEEAGLSGPWELQGTETRRSEGGAHLGWGRGGCHQDRSSGHFVQTSHYTSLLAGAKLPLQLLNSNN